MAKVDQIKINKWKNIYFKNFESFWNDNVLKILVQSNANNDESWTSSSRPSGFMFPRVWLKRQIKTKEKSVDESDSKYTACHRSRPYIQHESDNGFVYRRDAIFDTCQLYTNHTLIALRLKFRCCNIYEKNCRVLNNSLTGTRIRWETFYEKNSIQFFNAHDSFRCDEIMFYFFRKARNWLECLRIIIRRSFFATRKIERIWETENWRKLKLEEWKKSLFQLCEFPNDFCLKMHQDELMHFDWIPSTCTWVICQYQFYRN